MVECYPGPEVFQETYNNGKVQLVWTRLLADLDTPVSIYIKLSGEKPNSFLMESVEGGTVRGRYSFIGMDPDLIWRCFADKAQICTDPEEYPQCFTDDDVGTLESLRRLEIASRVDIPDELPPMAAGLVGYLGYDIVRLGENIPDTNKDVLSMPDGIFIRPTLIAIFDNIEDTITIVTPVRPETEQSAKTAWKKAKNRLGDICKQLSSPLSYGSISSPSGRDPGRPKPNKMTPKPNMTKDHFKNMVAKAKDYIRAGDIFQVVLSQRFETPFNLSGLALYRSLRRINPSPFMFFLKFSDFSIVGSSPEILVRLRNGKITIRPIAGTCPRGESPEHDKRLEQELLSDSKECAEHLMLLDLGRNDMGRVAEIGTIRVTDQFIVERYSHVMHIVSNIEGEIAAGCDALMALMAGFPAGTVSGAPKVRAMEIIEELESDRRGIYAGCIGYFGANGGMDSCIALRTAIVKDGTVFIQAGAGVVADSDPDAEYEECVNKSQAIISAVKKALENGKNI